MRGRVVVIAGIAGVAMAHQLEALPSKGALFVASILLGVALIVAFFVGRIGPIRRLPDAFARPVALETMPWLIWAGWLGFSGTVLWAQFRMDHSLAPINVDRVVRVTLRIESLPRLQPDQISFEARVLHAHPAGVPERLRVTWAAPGWRGPYAAPKPADPPFPEVRAGQVWRMALITRPVSAAQNQHAFDYEAYAFAAGVRAIGRVRGNPEFLRNEDWANLSVVAERARHAVRKATDPYLASRRYGAVLRALAIGDQDGVSDADWLVFNRSGLTHLVSISGSHITMLSAFGALATAALWRRLRWRGRGLAERWPARRAAACAALLVAWLYCLLAGWGVPARRTFMMLAVVAGSQALQLRLSGSRVLAIAALAVLAMDPWAILASGFWLSFLAVGVLLAVGADRGLPEGRSDKDPSGDRYPGPSGWKATLRLAAWLQWAVTWALVPPLAWIFHEISLVSPFANAYAIPMIELVVTPLSLLLAAAALIPGLEVVAEASAWLGHGLLWLLMQPTQWLAGLPTIPVPARPAGFYLLACLGAMIALCPRRGFPSRESIGQVVQRTAGSAIVRSVSREALQSVLRYRALGWLALLPMVVWPAKSLDEGTWDLRAFDVGQGSAILVQTARHAVLFDAGARHARDADEGTRTILPALRALGVRRLDALIVSHADLDHAGGARGILQGIPVRQVYSSFALEPWLQNETRKLGESAAPEVALATPCRFGTHWRIDGVRFEFLWPLDVRASRPGRLANAGSCVLRVEGRHHSALLTGDIEAQEEQALVTRGLGPVDLVVAAHHGSRTSSSDAFANAVAARHILFQAGRWNRHGHPHGDVLARWQVAGAMTWRTDLQGGILAQSRGAGLQLHSMLESSRRYWHAPRR